MLSLRAILENKKAVQVVNRRNTNTPDMVIETKDNKTMVTLSQSYMDKADLQNNRIMAAFEPGDNKVYFIIHSDENLYSDFMTGKNIAQKNEAGEFILDEEGNKTYKLGKKTNSFQDSRTSQDATLSQLLENITILDVKNEFNLISLDPKSVIKEADEFNISSIWEIQNKKDVVESKIEDNISFDNNEASNNTEDLIVETNVSNQQAVYENTTVTELF